MRVRDPNMVWRVRYRIVHTKRIRPQVESHWDGEKKISLLKFFFTLVLVSLGVWKSDTDRSMGRGQTIQLSVSLSPTQNGENDEKSSTSFYLTAAIGCLVRYFFSTCGKQRLQLGA